MSFWSTNRSVNRRHFLQAGGSLTLATLLGDLIPVWTRKALAEGGDAPTFPNFVLLRTFGGMDATLGLDPQVLTGDITESDCFLEYRPDQILKAEGLRFGPAAAPLVPHAKECLVVNGVMMRRDAGHEVLNQYLATGRGDGKAAAIPAELALALETGPFGLLGGGVYLAGKAIVSSSPTELITEAFNETLVELIEEKIKEALPEETPLKEAEKAIIAGKKTAMAFIKHLEELKKSAGTLNQLHVLTAAMATGACFQAQLDIFDGFLDTHSNHEKTHLAAQEKHWAQVAEVLRLFKSVSTGKGSLLDETLVMVVSEFSRTPALNAAKGKDHNPFTNSVLLAGGGIRGGTVVGQSHLIPKKKSKTGMAEHYATPFNYKEGKFATSPEGASFFYPENLVRTIAKLYGDPKGMKSAVDYSLPLIPGILKG